MLEGWPHTPTCTPSPFEALASPLAPQDEGYESAAMTLTLDPKSTLPTDSTAGTLVGRVWRPELSARPSSRSATTACSTSRARSPTMRDLCESADPAAGVAGAQRDRIGDLAAILANTAEDNARPEQALAARADRPAGREGGGRHLRDLAARTRDRGAGARRAGARGAGARRSRERARRQGRGAQARLAAGDGAEEAAAGRRACGRSISKSASGRTPRSSPSRQVHGRGRHRHVDRRARVLDLEQSRARGRGGRHLEGQDRRRDARQRREPARRRGPLRAAALARRRTTTPRRRSARSSACSTRPSRSTTCAARASRSP